MKDISVILKTLDYIVNYLCFPCFGIGYHVINKGRQVNIIEKHYVLRDTKKGTNINDRNTPTENKIFNVLLKHE